MPEIRTVTTLKRKREEIAASIRMYEKKIAQARADLAHVAAAIGIFGASDRPRDLAKYVDHYRLFKRGEPWAICAAALADGPRDTKELALALMRAKGMDLTDAVLTKAIGHKLIHSLRMQEHNGRVKREGKRQNSTRKKTSGIPPSEQTQHPCVRQLRPNRDVADQIWRCWRAV